MAEYGCEVIIDSEIQGERITCFRVTYPRIVHSEFLRHRMGSFCSSSSRAIPLERLIDQYVGFYPDNWRKHQSGMQPIEGDNLFRKDDITFFNASWGNSKSIAIETARDLHKEGVAKEQVNRLLEPYSFITHLVQMSESGYKNFFQLRTDSNAQYEIRVIANMMKEMYRASFPLKRKVHLPFYQVNFVADKNPDILKYLKVSSARCARTSYHNHEGNTPTLEEDLKLSETLLKDRHLSPFEFPVIDRFEAENIFPDLKWWEFVDEARWWKKVELKEGLPIAIRNDLSGNLANWKIVQYRKILEMSDI
jgi:thymidylate synthase ThyX